MDTYSQTKVVKEMKIKMEYQDEDNIMEANNRTLKELMDISKQEAEDEIWSIPQSSLMGTTTERMVNSITAKHGWSFLHLQIEESEIRQPRESGRDFIVTQYIPIKGNWSILQHEASTRLNCQVYGNVDKERILVKIKIDGEIMDEPYQTEEANKLFAKNLENIRKLVKYGNNDVEKYNKELSETLANRIETRKKRLENSKKG